MPRRSWFALLGSGALVAALALDVGGRSPVRAAPGDEAAAVPGSVPLAALPPCSAGGADPATSGPPAGPSAHVAPQLDEHGSLVGWLLETADLSGASTHIHLPPESSVSPDVAGRVVVTVDDGAQSVVAVVSAPDRCATVVARVAHVARSAVMRAGDSVVWYHAVDRATRRDLGIWTAASLNDVPLQVVDALGADDPAVRHVGRVFMTRLLLDPTGERLAIQSCGDRSCRSRIVDVASGQETRVDADDQGPLVSFDRNRALFRASCPEGTCPLRTIALAPQTASPTLPRTESSR